MVVFPFAAKMLTSNTFLALLTSIYFSIAPFSYNVDSDSLVFKIIDSAYYIEYLEDFIISIFLATSEKCAVILKVNYFIIIID